MISYYYWSSGKISSELEFRFDLALEEQIELLAIRKK